MKKTPKPEIAPPALGAPAVLNVASVWEERTRAEVDRLESELVELEKRRNARKPEDDGMEWGKEFDILNSRLESAEKRWKMRAQMVHIFDKSVDPSKRSAEETITREEGGKLLAILVITFRTAVERLKENIVPRIRESATNEQGFMIVDQKFSEEFENAAKTAVNNNSLPQWTIDAVEGAL